MLPLEKPEEMEMVLACQDRFIRVLAESAVRYEVATPAAATALKHVPDSHDPQGRFPHARELLYGSDVGGLTQLMLEPTLFRTGFSLANTKKLGAIRAIYRCACARPQGRNSLLSNPYSSMNWPLIFQMEGALPRHSRAGPRS